MSAVLCDEPPGLCAPPAAYISPCFTHLFQTAGSALMGQFIKTFKELASYYELLKTQVGGARCVL